MRCGKLCALSITLFILNVSTATGSSGLFFFHGMKDRAELFVDSEKKIEAFFIHLALDGQVAPVAKNQAMNALVFLY